MKIELPELPYELDALEPYISASTLDIHYKYHHLAYVAKLSNLIAGTRYENADLMTIIREANGSVFYNATQIWNHSFYFASISTIRGYNLNDRFAEAIRSSFKSFGAFKEKFIKLAASNTERGWLWLIVNESGALEITQDNDTESPLRKGLKPILTIDLFDHAYNLDYRNKRIDYINSFWNLINWEVIEKRYLNVYAINELRKQLIQVF